MNLAIAHHASRSAAREDQRRLAAGSSVVAKAEEIIRARAHEALTIREVAAEVGVTVRSLQMGFRRELGFTPMQFLLNRRLILARERLLSPEFGGNVQYAAMSCGFMNMSRFSSRYRQVLASFPRRPLARARRRWRRHCRRGAPSARFLCIIPM